MTARLNPKFVAQVHRFYAQRPLLFEALSEPLKGPDTPKTGEPKPEAKPVPPPLPAPRAKYKYDPTRAYGEPAKPFNAADTMLTPEREYWDKMPPDERAHYESLFGQATDPHSIPFTGVIPHVSTIHTLAEFGSPAKGQYRDTAEMVKTLFGHDPHGVAAWMGLNGVFSPQTAYLDHAGAATMITAAWLAAGKPRDPDKIEQIIKHIHEFGKQYNPQLAKTVWRDRPEEMFVRNKPKKGKEAEFAPSYKWRGLETGQTFGGTTGAGDNVRKAVNLLSNIEDFHAAIMDPTGPAGRNLNMLSNTGMKKVVNFVASYLTPHLGSALDLHMGRLLLHPDLEDPTRTSPILKQLVAGLKSKNPREAQKFSDLDEALEHRQDNYPIKSDLIKAMAKHSNVVIGYTGKGEPIKVIDHLKGLSAKLNDDPTVYLAYKHTLAKAAHQMGWDPAEVQESVWTGIVALMAANTYGIHPKQIQEYLTNDMVRKGWQNHEAFVFPGLWNQFSRLLRAGGTSKATLDVVRDRAHAAATANSVGGAIPVRDPTHLGLIASHLPSGSLKDAGAPIRRIISEVHGLQLPKKFARLGVALRLAAEYDQTTNFDSAQTRALSQNTHEFLDSLKQVLLQAGVTPDRLSPAIHDVSGNARMAVLALGKFANPQAALTGAAWAGLLGRQPGMLSFTRSPQGADSVYTFTHPNADHVRLALDNVGIASRTLVPEAAHYRVYVYDRGRAKRAGVAQALASLGTQADEWIGTGAPVGGDIRDMGRAQYRDQINRSESAQQMSRLQYVPRRPRVNTKWRYPHEPEPQSTDQLQLALSRRNPLQFAAPGTPDRGNPVARDLVRGYVAEHADRFGLHPYRDTPERAIDPRLSMATADAFERMQHAPQDPHTKAAYDALIREVSAQYDYLSRHGVKMEPWLKPGQPYRNSRDMVADARNKHLWFFPTENPNEAKSFGDAGGDLDPIHNPLAVKTGHVVNGHELRANDLLRAVHDFAAHSKDGFEFGPRGEYNAWAEHAKMFSPLALQALTTETHGQNSWVNFGPHLRKASDGTLPVKGDPEWVSPEHRPFAEQKVNILPAEAHPPHPYASTADISAPSQMRRVLKLTRHGNEESEFLGHIRSNPADAAPHMVFADWLDEHGDSQSEADALAHRHVAGLMTQGVHPIQAALKSYHAGDHKTALALTNAYLRGHPQLHHFSSIIHGLESIPPGNIVNMPTTGNHLATMTHPVAEADHRSPVPLAVKTTLWHPDAPRGPLPNGLFRLDIGGGGNLPGSFYYHTGLLGSEQIARAISSMSRDRYAAGRAKLFAGQTISQNSAIMAELGRHFHANSLARMYQIRREYLERMGGNPPPAKLDRTNGESMRPPLKLTLDEVITRYRKKKGMRRGTNTTTT